MNWNFLQLHSLKARVTLFTLTIFLISIWSLAFYVSRMLHDDMQRLLGEQQLSTASIVADQINAELVNRMRVLESSARRITPAILGNTATIQTRLDENPALQELFNAGVVAIGADGTAIAEFPHSIGVIGVNLMDRDNIVGALKKGESTFGRPVMGKKLVTPIVGIAAPIRDPQGKVIGALSGLTDLGNPNFLDKIAQNRFGKTGGFLLVAPQYRLIVTASNKSRIMETLPSAGRNPTIDRFINGYEGSVVFTDALGVEVLTSTRNIPVAHWQLAASLPTSEAFAPIRAMQQRMLLTTIFLTLLAGGLTWWMLKRQLLPMLTAVKTLASLSDSNHSAQPLPITSQDEIGELIGGFNHLLATLAQREQVVKESEHKLSVILESVDAYIYLKDTQGRYLFANRPVRELFGASMEEIMGQRDENFFDAETAEKIRNHDRQVLDEGKTLKAEETNVNLKDGYSSTYITVKLPLRNQVGKIYALCGISTDITERKRMEEQVRQMAFHDTLTKLPNRRLLNDRLRQNLAASRRSGYFGAAIFLDLDNFKPLNDAHGHEVGDLLLIEAADRLRHCVREMDTVARFGGDEFVVVLSQLDRDKTESVSQARIVAEKIQATLSEPYRLVVKREGKTDTTVEHRCTASIGVVLFVNHEGNQDDILKWADIAMYQAKQAGSNLIRFYDPNALATAI